MKTATHAARANPVVGMLCHGRSASDWNSAVYSKRAIGTITGRTQATTRIAQAHGLGRGSPDSIQSASPTNRSGTSTKTYRSLMLSPPSTSKVELTSETLPSIATAVGSGDRREEPPALGRPSRQAQTDDHGRRDDRHHGDVEHEVATR